MKVMAFDRQTEPIGTQRFDSMVVDYFLGAQLAVRHLLSLGHGRIGLVSGPISPRMRRNRIAGYRTALIDASIVPDPRLIWDMGSSTSGRDTAGMLGNADWAVLGRAGAREILSSTHRGIRPNAARRSGERAGKKAREEIRGSELGTVPG